MPRMTSRLARRQEKKLKSQTIKLIIMAIAIVLIFVFVVMPYAIKLFFWIIDRDSTISTGDDVPPQVPVISSPVEATFSAQIKIEGYGEPKSETVFVLNSEELDRVKVSDEGKFEYELTLEEGENQLTLYGIDEAENESIQTKSYNILYDSEAPTLTFDELQDGQTIETTKNKVLTIRGITEAKAKVMLNGRITYAKSDGSFSTTFNLAEGENKLEFEVIDTAGNSTKQELTLIFKY